MSQQQKFEDALNVAVRESEQAVLGIRKAALAAGELGDEWACGALDALADALFRLLEQVAEQKDAVDARLADTREEAQ